MAWRPSALLQNGVLDNTKPGVITGQLDFYGVEGTVELNLQGDFHRDIRGATILLKNYDDSFGSWDWAQQQIEGFGIDQEGVAGDITAGLEPFDYTDYPYIEWYSKANGRVVLELEPEFVRVVGTPLPWQEQPPLNPNRSRALLEEFVRTAAAEMGAIGGVLKRS